MLGGTGDLQRYGEMGTMTVWGEQPGGKAGRFPEALDQRIHLLYLAVQRTSATNFKQLPLFRAQQHCTAPALIREQEGGACPMLQTEGWQQGTSFKMAVVQPEKDAGFPGQAYLSPLFSWWGHLETPFLPHRALRAL